MYQFIDEIYAVASCFFRQLNVNDTYYQFKLLGLNNTNLFKQIKFMKIVDGKADNDLYIW